MATMTGKIAAATLPVDSGVIIVAAFTAFP